MGWAAWAEISGSDMWGQCSLAGCTCHFRLRKRRSKRMLTLRRSWLRWTTRSLGFAAAKPTILSQEACSFCSQRRKENGRSTWVRLLRERREEKKKEGRKEGRKGVGNENGAVFFFFFHFEKKVFTSFFVCCCHTTPNEKKKSNRTCSLAAACQGLRQRGIQRRVGMRTQGA